MGVLETKSERNDGSIRDKERLINLYFQRVKNGLRVKKYNI